MANWPGIYDTGAASVAEGTTTVTLHAAGPVEQALRPGDRFGSHVGRPIRITAVGPSTLTLAFPWPGPSQTEAPYEIALTPYDSGYRQALQTLVDRYGGGGVAALAEIEGALDTLPYFTGPGAMEATDLTPFARTLLDDADAATMLATLGGTAIGQSIGLVKQASALDTTSGRLLTVGAFGLGARSPILSSGNLNSDLANGFYYCVSCSNIPPGAGNGWLFNDRVDVGNARQEYVELSTGRKWIRRVTGSSVAWSRVFTQADILGTVSHSAGVPTGAIIERGNNSNGSYIRYADGTQICWTASAGSAVADIAAGNVFRGTVTWTFPAAFAGEVSVISNAGNGGRFGGSADTVTNTSAVLSHFQGHTSGVQTPIGGIAFGRWF